jgi:hypothetical protein
MHHGRSLKMRRSCTRTKKCNLDVLRQPRAKLKNFKESLGPGKQRRSGTKTSDEPAAASQSSMAALPRQLCMCYQHQHEIGRVLCVLRVT